MPAYLKKSFAEIQGQALAKLASQTNITATSPGTVARGLVDALAQQQADMYEILDFNVSQSVVTTAAGSALDALGVLYDLPRKNISDLSVIDRKMGSFIFYLKNPHSSNIVIPKGTNIYSDPTSYIGRRFSYSTTEEVTIPAGRLRAYATIQANFVDTSYPAGKNTLLIHDVPPEPGYTLYCTNPKEIAALQGSLESDDQYRLRLIKHVRVTAGGTGDALRFAGLSAAGVRDIRIRQAPYGLGGFEAVIVREKNAVGNVMDRAIEAMNNVRPVGVKMYTRTPSELRFDMDIDIIAPLAASAQAQETLTKRVIVGVSRYINSLLPGGELVYNQLLQMIMDSSEQIKDLAVNRFRIDGVELLRRNYRPSDDQQIVVGDITAQMARP